MARSAMTCQCRWKTSWRGAPELVARRKLWARASAAILGGHKHEPAGELGVGELGHRANVPA